jgi:hypothetical protein
MDIECIGVIGFYRAADRREAMVLSKQPVGDYEPLPVVATTRRAQRRAAYLWDDMVWDEV